MAKELFSDSAPQLTDRALSRLTAFLQERSGIELDGSKRLMVQSRLLKRLRALELSSFDAYCELLANPSHEAERDIATDLLTTHKTDFFRESHHFDFLIDGVIKPFCRLWSKKPRRLRVWSAGCSSGEEPYTISMVLLQHMGGLPFRVLATDIAQPTLKRAQKARYPASASTQIPPLYRTHYRRLDTAIELNEEVRSAVEFRHHNLMSALYPSRPRHHVIFIRNTLVYFSDDDQRLILERLVQCLAPRGFLFLGHSESATGLGLPIDSVGPTIYRKLAR